MNELIGKRIELVYMDNDPNPIEEGTMGTITNIGNDVINVDWDNGRKLGLVIGIDQFLIHE